MRLPWIATLDALIDELSKHRTDEGDELETPGARGVLSAITDKFVSRDRALLHAICRLESARVYIQSAARFGDKEELQSKSLFYLENTSTLDELDNRELERPSVGGRKGLAQLLENGGIVGPDLGGRIAQAISGEPIWGPGKQLNREEYRERHFAVKQVATIHRLWDVSKDEAIEMFCHAYRPWVKEDSDDAEKCFSQIEGWWKILRKEARDKLREGSHHLSDRERQNCRSLLDGLYPEVKKGSLRNWPYPEALKEIKS